MTIINGYATLLDFKNWLATPGQSLSSAAIDDTVIEGLIQSASRYIDNRTGRVFIPHAMTRKYDTPQDDELWFDEDLLEVITLTNGDDTTIASTEYNLYPANYYPKYKLRLKESSTTTWEDDDDGNTEQVIDLSAIWGCREDYTARAWVLGSAINNVAGITATATSITIDSETLFHNDDLIKIDNELMRVTGTAATSLTVVRGENGSTAATHDDDASIYIWQVAEDIHEACLSIAMSAYKRRWGENTSGTATITGAGVVITPADVSGRVKEILNYYNPRIGR